MTVIVLDGEEVELVVEDGRLRARCDGATVPVLDIGPPATETVRRWARARRRTTQQACGSTKERP